MRQKTQSPSHVPISEGRLLLRIPGGAEGKESACNAKVKVAQPCPTLCDPVDCSLTQSSVHGILQARRLEWVAVPFSRGSSQHRDQTQFSCIAGSFCNIQATKESKQETQVQFLGWEEHLEKGMATYSSILAWRIPCIIYIIICVYDHSPYYLIHIL